MSDYAEKKGRERGNIENKSEGGRRKRKKEKRDEEREKERERETKWRERHILRGRVGHVSPSISTSRC